jgi:hypothetical protein
MMLSWFGGWVWDHLLEGPVLVTWGVTGGVANGCAGDEKMLVRVKVALGAGLALMGDGERVPTAPDDGSADAH